MSTSRRSGARKKQRVEPAGGARDDVPSAWQEDLFAQLEAEIDKLRPLPEARPALILMGRKAIVLRDGPAMQGFVIVGENQQPRMIARDGKDMPFRLADLAADLRERLPMLFEPGPVPEVPSSGKDVPAPSRDWLHVAARHAEPAAEPVSRPAVEAEAQSLTLTEPGSADKKAGSDKPVVHLTGLHGRSGTHASSSDLLPRTTALRPTFVVYGGLLLAAVALLTYAISWSGEPDEGPPAQQVSRAPVTPPAEVEAPKPSTPASPAPSAVPHAGVPEVIDTATLRIERKIVRLHGVEWQRGANADDLTRYIASRPVTCEPVPDTDKHRCRIEGRDLSEVVLYNGGGRATSDASPALKAAEEAARQSGFGVWQKR
jgi:endonuclease YncB( thermonuclease family)